jgi:glycosyltransferase involved in cell wall biosynthesis
MPSCPNPVDSKDLLMKPAPIVSVVMPAYKVAPYIGEALQSVFAQTFSDYEVIVVNDGSPDTAELEKAIEPYRHRITYLKQENRGASAARNAALRLAQGEFIAFLDADDIWLGNHLEEQLRFLKAHAADLTSADAIHFGDSHLAGRTYMEACIGKGPAEGEVTFWGLVKGEQSLITSGVVARRKLILEVGLFDEGLRDAEDFDLWLRLARHGARMVFHRRVLLRYRCHKDNLSGDQFNVFARGLRAYDRIEATFDGSPEESAALLSVLKSRRAILEFELGKLYLENGDFSRAREAFVRANKWHTRAKSLFIMWFTRLAPALTRSLYLRRRQA